MLSLLGRGRLFAAFGRYPEARADLEQALSICQDCEYRLHEADVRIARAELTRAEGTLDAARKEAEWALSLARETGYVWSEGHALHLLGEILVAQDCQEVAREMLNKAFEMRQRIQDPRAEQTSKLLSSLIT